MLILKSRRNSPSLFSYYKLKGKLKFQISAQYATLTFKTIVFQFDKMKSITRLKRLFSSAFIIITVIVVKSYFSKNNQSDDFAFSISIENKETITEMEAMQDFFDFDRLPKRNPEIKAAYTHMSGIRVFKNL